MQEWCKQDFKGADVAEVEEDLEEFAVSWYATISEGQDIMPMIVQIWHGYCVYISPCLIMRGKIVLR